MIHFTPNGVVVVVKVMNEVTNANCLNTNLH